MCEKARREKHNDRYHDRRQPETMHDLAESKKSRGIVEKWPEGKIKNLNKVDR